MNDNNLIHENEVLRHELALLRDWKKSVIAIESEWDEQAIAKMLGAKLGEPCRKVIAREVPKLVADNAALKEALKEISTTAHCIALAGPLNTPTLQDAWAKFMKIDSMASVALVKKY